MSAGDRGSSWKSNCPDCAETLQGRASSFLLVLCGIPESSSVRTRKGSQVCVESASARCGRCSERQIVQPFPHLAVIQSMPFFEPFECIRLRKFGIYSELDIFFQVGPAPDANHLEHDVRPGHPTRDALKKKRFFRTRSAAHDLKLRFPWNSVPPQRTDSTHSEPSHLLVFSNSLMDLYQPMSSITSATAFASTSPEFTRTSYLC